MLTDTFPFPVTIGHPEPYGVKNDGHKANFAVFARDAAKVFLCLESDDACYEFQLKPQMRTGNVWHVTVHKDLTGWRYGWRIVDKNNKSSPMLLDPYAQLVLSHSKWDESRDGYYPIGIIPEEEAFDWEGDRPLRLKQEDLIIYEMHVRGFTQDSSSNAKNPGTFLGVIEKIPHLKELGVTAVELLPVHEFNEAENNKIDPTSGKPLCNYWGYSTVSFFAPMRRYSSCQNALSPAREFKQMVKELHKAGIEVILDVVFNHTAESGIDGPTLSFRGFANDVYYMLDPEGKYLNFSGCGNTFNCNHPVVRTLIQNVLRYWVSEMHVDGFRFDLASILGRAQDGSPLDSPPLLEAIALDPLLSGTKLIAEAWDAGGLYQVGSFPSWGVWSEWNGKWRDHVRKFIKGDKGMSGEFATRLAGSKDLYGKDRSPLHSINFITCHDGFSLKDLYSYNEKHNLANGEENKDGSSDNDSWNCGIEGPTTEPKISELRYQLMRNCILALMISQGTPMLLMGDEYGHTKAGNNNTWCHDGQINWFLWNEIAQNKEWFRFIQKTIHLRKTFSALKKPHFLTPDDITWHGNKLYKPNWDSENRLVAFTLHDKEEDVDFYIAFNSYDKEQKIILPEGDWKELVNTSKASPKDIQEEITADIVKTEMILKPYSAIFLLRRSTDKKKVSKVEENPTNRS